MAVRRSSPCNAPSLLVSLEADVFPLHRPELADVVDGAIGEGSPFHETFGYYAHGVGPDTAVVGPGWLDRLRPLTGAGLNGAIGRCLDPDDLGVAKLAAGRDKDLRFVREALDAGLMDADIMETRIRALTDSRAPHVRLLGLLAHVRGVRRPH